MVCVCRFFSALFPGAGHAAADTGMLLANGVAMKQIQEWPGHSGFSTTANIYAHMDFNSKISSVQAMMAKPGMTAEG